MTIHVAEETKTVMDVLSFTTVLATLAAWLPPLAAAVSILWGMIRIYETDTVQKILQKRRERNCEYSEGGTD
jgi:hypothetical protein